ncbi:MAG: TadE/TadG family type IV pilus assembly protein [Xanthobacteraceae bacterium]
MRRFWSDCEGNIALLFALTMIPMFGAVGVALDYSMASAYRTDMQKALDATALALTRIMPANQATLDTVGNQYFQANFGNHTLTNLQLTVTPEVGKLKLSAKGTYRVQMANIVGASTIELGTNSEAKWSIGKVEIALSLDNTGSMLSNNKIGELKAATHNLLDVLEAAAKTPGDAKVAIIPFNTTVNVGTSYKNEAWLRWDLLDCNGGQSGTGCGSPPQDSWTGCATDRNKDPGSVNYNVKDTEPAGDETKYPGVQCSGGLASIMPLTYDWNALHNKVNSLAASGTTNVTIGLVWGWHMLSPSAVFTQGVAYNTDNLQKYIILLTDGDNTQDRWSSSEWSINNRTAAACNNIKALLKPNGDPQIKIYTVRVIDGNANLLQNCATNSSMYYDVQNASELSSVFSSIGAEIANLHLSK